MPVKEDHAVSEIAKLIKELDTVNAQTRKGIIQKLGNYGGDEVLAAMTKCLKDPDWFVRLEAVTVMSRMKDDRAADPLKDLYFEALRRNQDMSVPLGFHEFVRSALKELGWELSFGGFERIRR
jgi:HEAT repeat protein